MSILTPERLEAAVQSRSNADPSPASGRMVTGNLSSHVDAELTQKEYTSVPDPENPGYMTNGLPVLPDTSEVVNGIRYSIPMWKPSLVRGGRVMVRRSREPGEKGKVLEVTRIGIGKAAQSFASTARPSAFTGTRPALAPTRVTHTLVAGTSNKMSSPTRNSASFRSRRETTPANGGRITPAMVKPTRLSRAFPFDSLCEFANEASQLLNEFDEVLLFRRGQVIERAFGLRVAGHFSTPLGTRTRSPHP